MARVRINSGPIVAEDRLDDVPPESWRRLVNVRRDYMAVRLTHDCRCLARFVNDAGRMWETLGYESRDDMILRGYELEPEEIEIAVRWLELNSPEDAIGLPEVKARSAQQMAADDGVKPLLGGEELDKARAEGGSLGGRPKTQQMADDVSLQPIGGQGDNLHDNVIKVKSPLGNSIPYLVRRLKRDAPHIADALGRGEYPSARAAGIAAGIVKVPTPKEQVSKLIPKLDKEELAEVLEDVKARLAAKKSARAKR